MYISDKDALQYASRIVLLLVPLISSWSLSWSWIIEILLIFAVFLHAWSSGLRLTVNLLAIGYLASIIPLGIAGLPLIGYTPWAAVFLLLLRNKGLSMGQCMFWSLILAALLSALPTIPSTVQTLHPEIIEQRIEEHIQLYEQRGTIQTFEKQGIPRLEFERYVSLAVPAYYRLLPALAGILGMMEIGLAYLTVRFSKRKHQVSLPFAFWRLPWYAVWVAIIGLVLYLSGDYLDYNVLNIAGLNIMLVIGTIAVVLGLSCASYFFQQLKIPRVLFWVAVVSAVFLPYYAVIVLLFIGLFDLVFNFRSIPEKK